MNGQTLNDKVIAWLADHLAIPLSKISMTSRIREDFGVDGDDAVELLQSYAETFRVDCSEFDYKRYFGDEGGLSSLGLIGKIFTPANETNRRSLTVAALIEGVRNERLVG
jgi:acyl carrier protein